MLCSNPSCKKKLSGYQKLFCSSSCAAKINNKKKLKRRCKICDELMPKDRKNCCSRKCYVVYNRQRLNERVKQGLGVSSGTIRSCLAEIKNKCWECDISSWNDEPLCLQVDHVDGNSDNNSFSNLRLLCPNCHSQTPTFGARNKGRGRKSRRKARALFKEAHGFAL